MNIRHLTQAPKDGTFVNSWPCGTPIAGDTLLRTRGRLQPRDTMTIIVGIPACAKIFDERPVYTTNPRIPDVLLNGVGALPISIPPVGEAQIGLLDRIDGLLIPGSPSNVHPSHYGIGESLTPDKHDPARDATTLPLIRAAIARGLPVLAICRGIQELNVALGGTLHQEVHALPGRLDHRGGEGSQDHRYRAKHDIAVSGHLARILGTT